MDNVIGLVANYYQVLSGIIPLVLSALQTGPTDSEVLRAVYQAVQELVREAGAVEDEIRMLSLAEMMRAPDGDLVILQNEPPNGPQPHVDPKRFFSDAEQAVLALSGQDVYWYRPFLRERTFSPQAPALVPLWYGTLPRPPTDTSHYEGYTTVLDPQLALPAFMKAIELFLAIETLLEPDGFTRFLEQWRATLVTLADTLEQRYRTLVQGLARSDVPTADDAVSFVIPLVRGSTPLATPEPPMNFVEVPLEGAPRSGWAWNTVFGVVDAYGVFTSPVLVPSREASHIVDMFPVDGIEAAPADEEWLRIHHYPWIRDRVVLGLMARWKALYIIRGYDRAWSVLQHLRVLTKQQGVHLPDGNRDWSARELVRELGLPTVQGDPAHYQDHSLSDLIERFDRVAKGTWGTPRDDVSPDQLTPRPVSFRERLAAAAV